MHKITTKNIQLELAVYVQRSSLVIFFFEREREQTESPEQKTIKSTARKYEILLDPVERREYNFEA